MHLQMTKISSTKDKKQNWLFTINYSKCHSMFDTITFHKNPHFANSTIFVYFS